MRGRYGDVAPLPVQAGEKKILEFVNQHFSTDFCTFYFFVFQVETWTLFFVFQVEIWT